MRVASNQRDPYGGRILKAGRNRGHRKSRSISEGGADRLNYIRLMLHELRQMAEEEREGTLVYMIEMAAMEAEETVRLREAVPRGRKR